METIIEINKDDIPYEFTMRLGNQDYIFSIDYNTLFDFFTIDTVLNGQRLSREKLVYGKPLYTTIEYKDIPPIGIMPYSATGELRVSIDNLGETVHIFLLDLNDLSEVELNEILA